MKKKVAIDTTDHAEHDQELVEGIAEAVKAPKASGKALAEKLEALRAAFDMAPVGSSRPQRWQAWHRELAACMAELG